MMWGCTLREGITCTVTEAMALRGLDEWAWHGKGPHRQYLRVADAVQLLQQAATGLAHMHARGFSIHKNKNLSIIEKSLGLEPVFQNTNTSKIIKNISSIIKSSIDIKYFSNKSADAKIKTIPKIVTKHTRLHLLIVFIKWNSY